MQPNVTPTPVGGFDWNSYREGARTGPAWHAEPLEQQLGRQLTQNERLLLNQQMQQRRANGGTTPFDAVYDSADQLWRGGDDTEAVGGELLSWLNSPEAQAELQRLNAVDSEYRPGEGGATFGSPEWWERVNSMTGERAGEIHSQNARSTELLDRFRGLLQETPQGNPFDESDIARRLQGGAFDPLGGRGIDMGTMAGMNNLAMRDPDEFARRMDILERARGGDDAAQNEWRELYGLTTGRMDPTLTLDQARQFGTPEQVLQFQRQQRSEASLPGTGPNWFQQQNDQWNTTQRDWWLKNAFPEQNTPRQQMPASWINGEWETDAGGNVTWANWRNDPFSPFQSWGTKGANVPSPVQQDWRTVTPSQRTNQATNRAFQTAQAGAQAWGGNPFAGFTPPKPQFRGVA